MKKMLLLAICFLSSTQLACRTTTFEEFITPVQNHRLLEKTIDFHWPFKGFTDFRFDKVNLFLIPSQEQELNAGNPLLNTHDRINSWYFSKSETYPANFPNVIDPGIIPAHLFERTIYAQSRLRLDVFYDSDLLPDLLRGIYPFWYNDSLLRIQVYELGVQVTQFSEEQVEELKELILSGHSLLYFKEMKIYSIELTPYRATSSTAIPTGAIAANGVIYRPYGNGTRNIVVSCSDPEIINIEKE